MEQKSEEDISVHNPQPVCLALNLDGFSHKSGRIIRCCAAFGIHKVFVVRDVKSKKIPRFGSHGCCGYISFEYFRTWEDLFHHALSQSLHIMRLTNEATSNIQQSHISLSPRFPLCIVVDDEQVPADFCHETVSIWFPDPEFGSRVPIESKLSILLYSVLQSKAESLIETAIVGNKFCVAERPVHDKP